MKNFPLKIDPKKSKLIFTSIERRLIRQLCTPKKVQVFLNNLSYNRELPPKRDTLRSFRDVVRNGTAHCLEAALSAAVLLEQHHYPPLVMSFESIDKLDHVIFVYQRRGLWGSIARSRDPGLHGRKAVFKSARTLALSYVDPYVDFTGQITGYAVVDLRELKNYNWRSSENNVWKVERFLLDYPHRPICSSKRRIDLLRKNYQKFKEQFPNRKPIYYRNRHHWTALPVEVLQMSGTESKNKSKINR